ncbi:MAG: hypothetical protein ACXVGO_04105 [Mycobacterium sp.]
MIDGLNATTETLIGVGGALSLLAAWWRWLRPKYKRGKADGVAIRDAILGRDAIVDSITKKEIAPALPGIGQRMATVEQALITFAQNRHDLDALIESHEKHDQRIRALEDAAVERVVTKAESAAAWRAMEAATLAQPDETLDEDQ